MYLIVGFEQSTLPRDVEALQWITTQMRDALESGRFSPAAGSDQPV